MQCYNYTVVHSHDVDDDPHAPYISAWANRFLFEYLRGQVLVVYTGLQLSSEGLLTVISGSTKVYQFEHISAACDLNHQVTGLCVCVCVCVCMCVRVYVCACVCVCVWGERNLNTRIRSIFLSVKTLRCVCGCGLLERPCGQWCECVGSGVHPGVAP